MESEHSSDGEVAGPDELERLLGLITNGTRELAMGHRRKGNELLKRLESEPAAVRDYLRREPERAQLLFDACVADGDSQGQRHLTRGSRARDPAALRGEALRVALARANGRGPAKTR